MQKKFRAKGKKLYISLSQFCNPTAMSWKCRWLFNIPNIHTKV